MLIFLNAFDNKVEKVQNHPIHITKQRLEEIEIACRRGQACQVAKDLISMIKHNPHNADCFLFPELVKKS